MSGIFFHEDCVNISKAIVALPLVQEEELSVKAKECTLKFW